MRNRASLECVSNDSGSSRAWAFQEYGCPLHQHLHGYAARYGKHQAVTSLVADGALYSSWGEPSKP